MERQKKVVDASVIVKWFLHEENSNKVINLIENHIKGELMIIMPKFIFLEVLNALKYKKSQIDKLKNAISAMYNAQFFLVDIDFEIIQKTAEISLEYNLSIYDAVYAALAQIHNCQLITEDKELKKFPNSVSL